MLGTGLLEFSGRWANGVPFVQSFDLRAEGTRMALLNPGAAHYWMLTSGRSFSTINMTVAADFAIQNSGTGFIRSLQSIGDMDTIGVMQGFSVSRRPIEFEPVTPG
jgi:hypothetical protein